ncbi:MAG TPA: hypothetical protein VG276_09145 [Actinomycetes bacterium]|nr:hypothetical protein [Actinomycetes bacterium]
MAVEGVSTQTPLLVQVLPTIVGGILGLAGVVYGAMRGSRAEHRRWLRQERLKVYSEFLEIAHSGLEAVNRLLLESIEGGAGDLNAIVRRADQTSDALQRPTGSIALLGPGGVHLAAGVVRVSLGWSARTLIELLENLDETLQPCPSDDPAVATYSSPVLTRNQLVR